MVEVWFGLGFFCIGWHFYHQRKMAEVARQYMTSYCEKNGLQFISIAKTKARLGKDERAGLVWKNQYCFEFSGDGESSYEGSLIMYGTQIKSVDMPPYRV